jgi:hypothetical protein
MANPQIGSDKPDPALVILAEEWITRMETINKDGFGGCGPVERSTISVVVLHELIDSSNQIFDTTK